MPDKILLIMLLISLLYYKNIFNRHDKIQYKIYILIIQHYRGPGIFYRGQISRISGIIYREFLIVISRDIFPGNYPGYFLCKKYF